MGESLLKPPTWGSLAAAANASMQADIDRVSRQASWDALPGWDDLPGWGDLFDTLDMWVLKVRSQPAAVGCSNEMIIAEAMRLRKEARGG